MINPRDFTVAIDDGHGMDTAGKRTPLFSDGTFMKENEFNRAVAEKLAVHLKRCGMKVIFTAPEIEDVPLSTRSYRANTAQANILVSIHANALTGEWGAQKGIETYVYKKGGQAEILAKCVHKRLMEGTPFYDRGIKEANFHMLRETYMPAILVECGFMDNIKEALLLMSGAYRDECAEEIAKGICDYSGIKYIPEEITWQELAKQFAISNGISDGSNPTNFATREQVWEMLRRLKEGGN